jgi:hypothetical protein
LLLAFRMNVLTPSSRWLNLAQLDAEVTESRFVPPRGQHTSGLHGVENC